VANLLRGQRYNRTIQDRFRAFLVGGL